MNLLILSAFVALTASSAFAQTLSLVCDRQTTFDKLCNPMIEGRTVDLTSDADEVCERLSYPAGAVPKSKVGTRDKEVFERRRDRQKYVGNIQIQGSGVLGLRKERVSKIFDRASREAIYSITCRK